MTGAIANRYRTVRLLGEGAMGQVWLAEDDVRGEQVALKAIGQTLGATEKSVLQFKQEFRLMAQLRHPNCCAVYDFGEVEPGRPFFTMELVPGQGLDEALPLPPARARAVLGQLLLALGYVHQLGLVHCDLKSANVRVRPDGTVKLMDYGLMDYAGRAGDIKGTVPYVSPEMVRRAPIDRRSDLYALGCLAYELVTGRLPFQKPTLLDTLRAHVSERPEPPSRHLAGLDAALEAVILKLLAKDPLERFQSAVEALRALGLEAPPGLGGNLLASPLVGRDTVSAALVERLAAPDVGRPVWLHGPAGSGKSRLLDQLRSDAQLEGFPYAMGSAFASHGLPYQPVARLVRDLLPSLRRHVPEVLARCAPVLVGLLPELGVAPAPEMDAPAKEKVRLHATLVELLRELAARQPFVAVLENWQWADALSREWLAYLLRNAADARCLLVLASRQAPAELDAAVEVVALTPLDAAALRQMVGAMLGQDQPEPTVLAGVAAASGGLPGRVEQLLEALVRAGHLREREGAWTLGTDVDLAQVASQLPAMREQQLDALPKDALTVLQAAAVLERDFDLDLLRAVAGLPDEALLAALDGLRHDGMLVAEDGARYGFAETEMQAAAYARLDAERRKANHAAAAAALQGRVGPGGPDEAPLELVAAIADHLLAWGPSDATIAYALAAGKRYTALLAAEDAGRLLGQGLAVARTSGHLDAPAWMLEFLALGAIVHRLVGEVDAARRDLEEAIALAERLGLRQTLGRLYTSLAKACQMADDYPAALDHCERSVALTLAEGDQQGAARALLTAARCRIFLGRAAEAVADAERARELAEGSGDRASVAPAYALQGYLYVTALPERLQAGVFDLTVAVALFEELNDRLGLINALTLLGDAQVMLGELSAARGNIQRVHQLAVEVDNRMDACVALANLAITALELEGPAAALARAMEGRAIADAVQRKFPQGVLLALEGHALVLQGRQEEGRECLERARALAEEISNRYLASHVLAYQAEACLYAGQAEGAAAAADELERLARETGDPDPLGRLAALRAELASRRGEAETAWAHANAALAHARERQARALEARAWQELARAELVARRWEEANEAARTGLAIATELGLLVRRVHLWQLHGEAALALGKAAAAAEAFTEMAEAAKQAGMAPEAALAAFGRAAARPYDPGARELAIEARQGLEGTVAGLDAEARVAFLAPAERARVLEGNYIAYGLPAAPAARPFRAGRPGLGSGPLL